jgi:hypothetical protein
MRLSVIGSDLGRAPWMAGPVGAAPGHDEQMDGAENCGRMFAAKARSRMSAASMRIGSHRRRRAVPGARPTAKRLRAHSDPSGSQYARMVVSSAPAVRLGAAGR